MVACDASPHSFQRDSNRKEIITLMAQQRSATTQLNKGLRIFFSEFARVSLSHPSQALFFARTVLWQRKAARLRSAWAAEGLAVPPIAIFSITNGCS
jgi:hypothetical protein